MSSVAAVDDRERPPTHAGFLFLAVYNLFYWPYLISTCALFFAPALVIFLFAAPWDPKRKILHAYTSFWGAHYLAWAPFAGVRVSGRERARQAGACIFVSNHQSMVDILAVFAIRLPFLWVSKIENFYVPFLGWNMWLNGYVPLKRGYLPSIMRMVRTCHRKLSEGQSLFVFPEGTRSPTGNLISFYPGAFRLAVRNKIPVVPVVIEGTRDILPKGRFFIMPRLVRIHLLEPVYPDSVDGDYRGLRDVVRERMQRELDEMRGGARVN